MTDALDSAAQKNIRERIGSKTFLEPFSLLVLVAPVMMVVSIFGNQSLTSADYLAWFIGNLISMSSVAVLIFGLRGIWFKFFPKFIFPFWSVFLIAALLGGIKGYLTGVYVLRSGSGDTMDLSPVEMIFGGSLAAAIALPITSITLLLLRQFNDERELLLTSKSLEKMREIRQRDDSKLAGLALALKTLIAELESGKNSKPEMGTDLIKGLVDRHIRPLAGDFYSELEKQNQSLKFKPLLIAATSRHAPAAAISASLLLAIPRTTVWFGWQTGVLSMLGIALAVFITMTVANSLIKKITPITFFSISTLIPLAIVLGVVEFYGVLEGQILSISVVIIVWLGQLSVVINMARVALETASSNREEVRKLLGTEGVSEYAVLRKQRRELANQIHGEVQSRLMNLVLQAEGGKSLNRALTIQELRNVTELIESGPAVNLGFEESLKKLKNTWSGFAKIDYNINQEIDPEQERIIFALIEEGVSNAFKHGLANKVTVELNDNQLVITDNGIGPTTGPTGLGSKLIDSSTQAWSLKPAEKGGSRLEMVL